VVLVTMILPRPSHAQTFDPRLARIETVPGITAAVGPLNYPQGVAVDGTGALFIADTNNDRVLRVAPGGAVSVLFKIPSPDGLAIDAAGNLYIAARTANNVWRLRPDGFIEVLAGVGAAQGFGGEGGPGRRPLSRPTGVAVDPGGDVFIADLGNHRIRKVTPDGGMITIAGTGEPGSKGDGGQAIKAQLNGPESVAIDRMGNLYITDQDNGRIRRVSPDGTIDTLARMKAPIGIAIDGAGDLFIADTEAHRILRLSPLGDKQEVAGTGRRGLKGDGGNAIDASLDNPEQLVVDHEGNIFIADTYNHVIRKIVKATAPAPRLGAAYAPGQARPGSAGASAPSTTGAARGAVSRPSLPNPVLMAAGRVGPPESNLFQLVIQNREAFGELFRPAPELPPCGTNANASRTWVNVFSETGTRINGYCAFNTLQDLDLLRTPAPPGTRVYVVLQDRATNVMYRSNTIELR
jgi:sugar lactone lactonase YvrE